MIDKLFIAAVLLSIVVSVVAVTLNFAGTDLFFASVFGGLALLGIRSTLRLFMRYWRIRKTLTDGRRHLILQAFVVVAAVITTVALYLGILSTRRLFGLPPLEWSAFTGWFLACVVLAFPVYLDAVVTVVANAGEDQA
jgi:hypothetical protein